MAENQNASPSGLPDGIPDFLRKQPEGGEKTAPQSPPTPEAQPEPDPSQDHPKESLEERSKRLKEECQKNLKSCGGTNPQKGTEMEGNKSKQWLWPGVILIALGIGWYVYQQMPKAETPATVQSTPKVDLGPLTKAVNDQSDKIASLEKEIANLKGMVAEVKECACKKQAPKQPVKKVAPKPAPKPAPAVAPPVPAPKVEKQVPVLPALGDMPKRAKHYSVPLVPLPEVECCTKK